MKKQTKSYLWVLIANALLIGAVAIIYQARVEAAIFGEPITPVVQGTMQDFQVFDEPRPLADIKFLYNLDEERSLRSFKGEWLLLNLWAGWCPPCLVELPSLQALSEEYAGKNLKVISISIDEADNAAEISAIIRRHELGDIAKHWDNKGEVITNLMEAYLPVTYLIDPAGRIIGSYTGDTDWVSPDARVLFDSVLPE